MKLTALAPKWLEWEGTRVGIVFRCPCCHDKPDGKWLTAFVTPLPQWNSWEELGGTETGKSQISIAFQALGIGEQ